MKLIIEGCDLSGKTFAIDKILKLFKNRPSLLIKNGYKPSKAGDETIYTQYRTILDLVERYTKNGADVILDRFYPSQAVYSILRGADEMEDFSIIQLDEYCAKWGYTIIYLDTALGVLEGRYDVRGDEHIDKSQLLMLKQRYDFFMRRCSCKVIYIDTLQEGWLEKLRGDLGI